MHGTPWVRVLRVSVVWLGLWLLGRSLVAVAEGRWPAYAHGPAAVAAFLLVAPLGEELLFRGAIFELVQRGWPGKKLLPVTLSAVFFSVHHFELHRFQIDSASLSQVAFTLPMGLVFGALLLWTGSLWPAFGLHVLTNLPDAMGT